MDFYDFVVVKKKMCHNGIKYGNVGKELKPQILKLNIFFITILRQIIVTSSLCLINELLVITSLH